MSTEEYTQFTPTTVAEEIAVGMIKCRDSNLESAVKGLTDRGETKAPPSEAKNEHDDGPN